MSPLKALTRLRFRRWASRILRLPRSNVDYASAVGDGTGSSTVMAPLLWIARTFPEAPPALWGLEEGQEVQTHDHALLRLIARPNRFYTGPILFMATITDWNIDGNAYWLKLRDRAGQVRELWWAPHWMIDPKGDPDDDSVFIHHYEYRTGTAEPVLISPDDVVHFRFGLDADDPRKGYSPLKSVLREVFTDDEAANFTASLLKNMGVPGLIISPEKGSPPLGQQEADDARAYMKNRFSGDRRGEPFVISGPTKVEQFGFSPEQLMLRDLRRIPEERVSAVLGVPAIVAGLGAGLDRSTFTNMKEAREMAYESNIIPSQRILSEDVRFQLLAEFVADPFAWRFGFDLAKVRVLADDEDREVRKLDVAVRGGWAQVYEARQRVGLPVSDVDRVFLRQSNVTQVPAGGGEPRPLAPRRAGGSRASLNGHSHELSEVT